jgi:hypothetical protein
VVANNYPSRRCIQPYQHNFLWPAACAATALRHIDEHAGASPTSGAHAEVEEEFTKPQEVGGTVSTVEGEVSIGPRNKPSLPNAEQAVS